MADGPNLELFARKFRIFPFGKATIPGFSKDRYEITCRSCQ